MSSYSWRSTRGFRRERTIRREEWSASTSGRRQLGRLSESSSCRSGEQRPHKRRNNDYPLKHQRANDNELLRMVTLLAAKLARMAPGSPKLGYPGPNYRATHRTQGVGVPLWTPRRPQTQRNQHPQRSQVLTLSTSGHQRTAEQSQSGGHEDDQLLEFYQIPAARISQ